MEKFKQAWNYGARKRKEPEKKPDEERRGMTVREHMTQ